MNLNEAMFANNMSCSRNLISTMILTSGWGICTTGPQHALDDIKLRLAEHVKSVLIPGSIAFHSSRTDPILNNISRRLSSLKYHRRWSIPFISTVTGQLETEVSLFILLLVGVVKMGHVICFTAWRCLLSCAATIGAKMSAAL